MKSIPTPESETAKAETARILAEHKKIERTPEQSIEAANDPRVAKTPNKLAEMFGQRKARALIRGAEMRDSILRRKLPDY